MTTKLAALGVATASLTIPTATAFAQSAPDVGSAPAPTDGGQPAPKPGYAPFTIEDQPLSPEQVANMTWMSGEEADRLGISGTIPEAYPEAPPGVIPQGYLDALKAEEAEAAATMTPCPGGKQCMWTGGDFAGPGHWLNGGHSGIYWNWAEAKCVGSGNPDGNWKNCASSLKNTNGSHGFTVYMNSANEDYGTYKNVSQHQDRPDLGTFNNNIEKSVGIGMP